MSQKIKRADVQKIYSEVCVSWQKEIDTVLNEQKFNEEIEVSDTLLNRAFTEANASHMKLLKKFFKTPESVFDLIQTEDDLFKITGTTREEVIPWKNPKTKRQKSQNAYAFIQLITEAYDQGAKLDFTDTNQPKYYIWWERKSARWVFGGVGRHFCFSYLCFGSYFVSEKAAKDAVKKFEYIFIDYLPE